MRRFILFTLLSTFLALHPAAAQDTTLKSQIIVEGRYVTLGDLFVNAGKNAARNVAYAPEPGKRSIFDANWLYRVARAYGLNWRPLNLETRSIVERASQEIYRDEIEDKLLAAIHQRGIDSDAEIDFGNHSLRVYVAAEEAGTVGVSSLNIDQRTGRFVATLAIPENSPAARRIRVSGKIHPVVKVPVLVHRIKRGDLIDDKDIEWINVREKFVRGQTILDEDDLIGMAARRSIEPSRPVLLSQVRRPLLVPKGSLVTMNLQTAFMRLSVQGTALHEGSMGDVIQVRNAQSRKVVEARITGAGLVAVDIQQPVTLN